MNNAEKQGFKLLKETGLSFEIKFDTSPYSGGFIVNIPALIGTYTLRQPDAFIKAFEKHKSESESK